jgi:UDP-N-acetylglucosamine--N-acetylmuramyl-(pentapeptide) pyrophosphoryl-undecaprenol N-acetylglucosamine transferase
MRIIISGGGTGGHIYPAITIVKELVKSDPSCKILFVGTATGLEADIIPKEGLDFATINVRGFERRLSFRNIATVFKTGGSVWKCRNIVKKFQPDIVIGTGGYVCGPILLAASLMGVPTMIQEQNVIPGITNKLLSRFVSKIAVGYAEAAVNFGRNKDKVIFTGNPIRPEILAANRAEGIHALELDPSKRTILISGGSRGARSINRAMLEVHRRYAGNREIQLLHVTGSSEYNDIVGRLQHSGMNFAAAGNISIKPYLYNMPDALAAADLAVFRAGAVGLAELTARGIPSILIPYPYAAENHQEFNAMVMKNHGAAEVIHDAELTGEGLFQLLDGLMNHPEKLAAMAQASKGLGRPDSAKIIAQIAIGLSKSGQ